MEIQELEREKMEVVREISATNLKISEAKNLLFKLQEEETEYLEKREQKALEKVQKVLAESRDLLEVTTGNYDLIHEFCKTLSGYADFLEEAHEKFGKMLEHFDERNAEWDKNAKLQHGEIARQRKIVEGDKKALEEREKRMDEKAESLKAQREHIESQQKSLAAAFKVEKDLWEKLKKN